MTELERRERYRRLRRIAKAILFPFWLLFWIPAFVTRTVTETVWSSVSGAAGLLSGILAVAITLSVVIPVSALVLGVVLVVVPFALVVAAASVIFAVLTWPLRRGLWHYNRRRAWRRWFYALDEPGKKELEWEEWDEDE